MEDQRMVSKETCVMSDSTIPTALAVRSGSRTISKSVKRPKIRIIHIFAPEIIKTDVENFRELVQRLTGKPTDEDHSRKPPRKPIITTNDDDGTPRASTLMGHLLGNNLQEYCRRERVKMEQEMMWRGDHESGSDQSYGGGELCPYVDLDCYEEEFPLLAVDVSHVRAFEAAQLA